MLIRSFLLSLFSCVVLAAWPQSQADRICWAIVDQTRGFRAQVGAAVLLPGMTEPVVVGDGEYPMMSVFKLHVAVAALLRMEREGLSSADSLHVSAGRLHENTYSPLRERYADRDFRISWGDLLCCSVSLSDNNACDLLIDFAGGPGAVDSCVRRLGIDGFAISQTEHAMHERIENCYLNRTSPASVIRLLRAVCDGKVLVGASRDLLLRALEGTTTGPDKLRAGLPADVLLGHKTGSSDRLPDGAKIGDNDAGFFLLPDGRRCYVAVFIRDSYESDVANAALTARIARAAYDAAMRVD